MNYLVEIPNESCKQILSSYNWQIIGWCEKMRERNYFYLTRDHIMGSSPSEMWIAPRWWIWFPSSQNTITHIHTHKHTERERRHADGTLTHLPPRATHTCDLSHGKCQPHRRSIYSIISHILCLIIDKLLKQHQHQHESPIVVVVAIVFQVDLLCVCTHFCSIYYENFLKIACALSTESVIISRISILIRRNKPI